jgi:hypothetical protein
MYINKCIHCFAKPVPTQINETNSNYQFKYKLEKIIRDFALNLALG